MQRGRNTLGRIALTVVAVVGVSTVADIALNGSQPALASYCGTASDDFCGFALPTTERQPYCYTTEVPIEFTLTSESTAPQPSSAQVSGTYTYPGGGTGTWRMNIVGPIATTTSPPYHDGPSWGLNNAGNPYAIFNGDLGKTNLFLKPTTSPASAELVQFRATADADNLNGYRNTFVNHTNHWSFDKTYAQYRLEDPTNQTTRNDGIYNDTVLLYQRTNLDNRYSDYVVTGDSLSLWVQDHNGSAYEGWSQSAIAKYTSCLTVTQTGAYVDSNNNGYPDPGDNVEFTYILTNPGSAELSGINLADTGVTMNSSNLTVAGGASVTVTGLYPLTAADILNGSVTRNATASGDDLFGNPISDLADSPTVATNADPEGDGEPDDPTTVLLPPPPVDLGVTKTDAVDPVREGDTVTYTITVFNNGPGTVTADDVFVVYDELPPGLIDPQYSAPAPVQWDGPSGEIKGVDLAPGDQIELTVTAIAATSGITVDNKVTVKSPVADSDLTNNTTVETTTILPKADLKITKSAAPSPVVAGTEVSWTITVSNAGPNDATNVVVTDALPAEVTSPTVTGCSYSGTSCNLGTVAAGSSQTITITALVSGDTPTGAAIDNSASVTSDTEDPDPTNNAAASNTPVEAESDVVLVKSSAPNPYVPGQPITYTFTVRNSGPSTATGVVLKDSFPAGLSGFTVDSSSCAFSGADMTCALGTVGVGDTISITATADTDPSLVDPIVNEAYVDVSSNDPNLGNNLSIDENGAEPLADLRVIKSDLADPVLAGDTVTYTVSITNQGPSVATDVELSDDFGPAGIGLVLATTPAITAGSGSCTTTRCDFPSIGVGETAVIQYTIDVGADVAPGTTITNTASATSAVTDPNDADNVADETTVVKTQADLSITKVGADAPVAGEPFTYTLTIANAGPSVAGTTVVTDELPPGVTFVASGSSPTCSVSGAVVACDVASLAAGEQTEITIEVAVDPTFVGTLANTATVAAGSNAPDPDTSNNTATHTGVASAAADLGISKSVNKTAASAGTSLTWIVVVTNNGPSTASAVTLDDAVPAGVSVTSVTSTVSPSTCTSPSACTLGDLAPGDVATVTITGDIDPSVVDGTELVNVASVGATTTDPNGNNDDAQVATVVSSVADISLVKTADPNPYTPGGPVAFTISATNLGPSSAAGAAFVDDLPSNFTYTGYSVAAGSGSCSLSGTTITCSADPMAPGTTFTVVIDGDTASGQIASMSNTASMVAPSAYRDPEPGNDSSTVSLGSTPDADLGISKTPVGSATTPGATKRWMVNVTNAGPTDATEVVVTDVLPTGVTFVSAAPASGSGSCSHDGAPTGGVITCPLGAVPANSVLSIDVVTTIDPSVADGATITNTASVTSDTQDSNLDNNEATATVTASRIADVAVTKVDDPDPVVAGQPVTWTITVANAGPSDAAAVTVTDAIPNGFTIDSVSPSGCGVAANDVTCGLGAVAPGAPVEITVVATASSSYLADGLTNPVTNTASVASPDDVNADNDQALATTLVVERADVSITKAAPAEVLVGDTVTWTIDVANAGPSVAEGVVVTDSIPAGIAVDPAAVTGTGCALTGNDLECNLGTLAAGGSAQVVIPGTVPADYLSSGYPAAISNSAAVVSAATETDIANNQAAVDTAIIEEADLRVTKTAASTEVAAGDRITWTVTVDNDGPADARQVRIDDALPPGVTVVSATPNNGGSCDSAATCLLGTVGLGETVTITIIGEINADHPEGPIDNTASVSALTPDPDGANNSATATATVVVASDLVVSKTGPSSAVPGGPIGYTVTVFNAGPSDATGVELNDTLPAGLLDATATSDAGSCATADSCAIGDLAAGATATITIDATVDPDLTAADITNVASAAPAGTDPNPDNNADSATTAITPIADVSLTKIGDVNPVIAGTNLTWTLTAANAGPSTARNVVIYDNLPAGVVLVDAPDCAGTSALECSIPDLAPGTTYATTIEVAVDSSYYDDGHSNPLTNTASVATATPELNTANNTAAETTTVADLAGVAVGKSHEGLSVTAGDRASWLVTVVNTGPSSAQNVVVTDTLMSGTTFVSATASNGQTCSESGGTITCELGSIPLDGLVDIIVEVDVAPDYVSTGLTNPLSNSASATATTDDPNPADNTGIDEVAIADSADLSITKTGPAEVNAGDPISWEVTVTNSGPSVARDVTIDDPAPAGVAIIATTPAGLCDDFVTCQVGDLAPGQSATVTIDATVDSTWLIDGFPQPLSNAANAAAGSTSDPDGTNNTAYADTIVTEEAALTVTKTDNPDPVVAGEALTWVVSVKNDGPSIARSVIIDDPVPSGVSIVSATSSTGDGCTFDVTCTLETIAVGATETVTIVGNVDPAFTATSETITNVVSVTSPTNPGGDVLTASSDTTVNNRADLSITKTDGGAAVTAGETVNWSIAVSNAGPSDAPNTVVTDTLPAGLDLATVAVGVNPAAAGSCDTSALPALTCQLGTLPTNSTVMISVSAIVTSTYIADGNPQPMQNSAVVSSGATEVDQANNTSTELTPITVAADLTLTKSGPASVAAGESVTWTIDVGNLGPSAASGLEITDLIPTGLIVDSASPGCTIDGQAITCSLAQLAVGATHSVTIAGTVPADYVESGQPIEVTNGAQVVSDVADPDFSNNRSEVPTAIETAADLSVTKSVAPAQVAAGESATWTVTVTNAGPSVATNVAVNDPLPSGFTATSIDVSNGGSCDAATTCLLGSVAPGESVVVSVAGVVDADFVTKGGTTPIDNTATVNASETDPAPDNNAATASLAVNSAADLTVIKTGADTVVPGTTTEYTITVTNDGPSDALNTTVADTLPTELIDASLTPSQGTCSAGECDLGTVAAGSTVTIVVTGTVDSDTTADSITNLVNVASATADLDDTNNTASVTAAVAASADVAISKTESADPVVAGETLTWTIEATNNGPSTARNVVVGDVLPAGVTLKNAVGCDGTTTLSCAAGDIGVGETATFVVNVDVDAGYYSAGNESPMSNTATHTADTNDPEPLNDAHTELTTVAAVAGVSVGKSADVANTSAGSQIAWTITAYNAGPSNAENVIVTDPIPDGLTVTDATFDGQDCAISTSIVCDLGVVAVGQSITIAVASTVDQAYVVNALPNPLQNLTTVSSDTNDPEPADNVGGDLVNIVAADDVSVTKTGPETAIAGMPIEWTVTIINDGPSVAQGVEITDAVPAGIDAVVADLQPAAAGTCDPTVSCSLEVLAPGDTATVTISGVVSSTWLVDGRDPTLINTVNVSSGADADLTNNTASAITTIDDSAALSITKSASPEPVNAGEALTWTLEVANAGPSAASDVVVNDAIPTGIGVTDVATSQGSCTFDVDCELGSLAVGQTATITITGMVPASWLTDGGSASVTNTATVASPTNPDQTLRAEAVSTVAAKADVSIVKTDVADPVVAGRAIRWILTAANQGPSNASGTIVTDTLPDGLDLSTVAVSPDSANCDLGSLPLVSCDLGVLAAESSVAITIDAALSSTYLTDGRANPINNGTRISIDDSIVDPDPDNNADLETTEVLALADVSVAKSVAPGTASAGESVTFTIDAYNAGPSTATDVAVVDVVPAGIAITSAAITSAPIASAGDSADATPCSVAGQSVVCRLGNLPVGSRATVEIVGTVDSAYVANGLANPVVNSARVTTTSPDTVASNDQDAADLVVIDQANLSITKAAAVPDVVAGNALEWSATITNAGPSVARDVTVTDAIPDGYAVLAVSADNGAACDASSCLLGDLAVGESVTINITGTVDSGFAGQSIVNTASVASATDDPVLADNAANATAAVSADADLAVDKAGPAEFTPGESVTYQIAVTNHGPSTATEVSLTDELPAGFVVDTIATSQGTCDAISHCELGTLEPGGSILIDVTGTADPSVTDDFVNAATVDAVQPDSVGENNRDEVVSTVVASADVRIAKDDIDDLVLAGQQVSWTITASNDGPSVARSVSIADSLPAGTSLVSTSPSCEGGVDLTCSIGDLAPGTSATVTVVAAVDSNYYPDGHANPLVNRAAVDSTTPDPNAANNSSTDTTTIGANAGLSIAKDANIAQAIAGENIIWTLTVYNAGPSTGQGVVVTDPLPVGVTFVSAQASNGGTCSESAAALSCALGDLAVGSTVTIDVVATVTSDYLTAGQPQPLVNAAQVSGVTEDPFLGDNTGIDQLAIVDAADLHLTKTGPAETQAGSTVTWSITVLNDGPSVARSITVADLVPPGVRIDDVTSSGATATCSSSVRCEISELAPSDEITINIAGTVDSTWIADGRGPTLTNTAMVSAATPDPNGDDNSDRAITTVGESAALVAVKAAASEPAIAGTPTRWTIEVTNEGPSAARAVVVNDPAPAGTTVVAVAPSGSCTFAVNCTIDLLEVGETATFDIDTAIDSNWVSAGNGGVLTNTATISSPSSGSDTVAAEGQVAVEDRADVSVTKSANESLVSAGERVGWTIEVHNDGPSAARSTVLTDTVPAGVSDISPAPPTGVSCDTSALPTVTCDLGELGDGETISIPVSGRVDSSYFVDGQATPLTNTATVVSETVDPATDNNTSAVDIQVANDAGVAIGKRANETDAIAGTRVSWTLEVTNAGPGYAQAVTVSDPIPVGVTVTAEDVLASSGSCSVDAATVACDLGSVAPGATVLVTISGTTSNRYLLDVGNLLTNTATVTTASDDDPSDNAAAASTRVVDQADLVISKAASIPNAEDGVGPAVAGGPITWSISVINLGPSVARDVDIADALPDGVTIGSVASDTASCGAVDVAAATLTCTITELAPGGVEPAVVSVVVNGTVDADYYDRFGATPIGNTATAASASPDPTPASSTATMAITESADLVVSKVANTDRFVAGEAVSWNVTVTNNGPSTARDVVLNDVAPAGVSLTTVSTDVSDAACTLAIECTLGALAPATTATIFVAGIVDPDLRDGEQITNTATVESATPDPVANIDPVVVTPVVTEADLAIVKRVAADPVIAGDSIYWTLEIRNEGPSAASDVVVADQLPAGVALVAMMADGTSICDPITGCTFPDVEAGGVRTVTVVGTTANGYLSDGLPNPLTNNATVAATDPDPDQANNADALDSTVIAESGLSIVKSANLNTATAGAPLSWTLTVTNAGPSVATDVVVEDSIPAGVTIESIAAPPGSTCTDLANCELGNLGVGATATIRIDGVVDSAAVSDGITDLTNTASVRATSADANTSDNTASVTTPVVASADLSLVKVANGDTGAGGVLTWTLTVNNTGPSAAEAVIVTDRLPDGLSLVSVDADTDTVSCSSEIVCDVGRLAAGETVVITVRTATPVDATTSAFVNSAEVTSPTPDPSLDNNGGEATGTAFGAQIGLAKRVVGSIEPVGDGSFEVVYELSVANTGGAPLSGTQISDDLAGQFGDSARFRVVSVTSDDLAVNPAFDGVGVTNLLSGTDRLVAGQQGTVRLQLTIAPKTNPTTISNIATASGSPVSGVLVTDVSADGSSVDPDGDGDPANNAGSTDTTLDWNAKIGAAKEVVSPVTAGSDGSFIVSFDIDVVNFGSVELREVQVRDDLRTTYAGATSYSVLSVSSDDLTVNPNFDGVVDTNLLAGSDTLAVGQGGSILLTTRVLPQSANDTYSNIARADAVDPAGTPIADLSAPGSFGCDGELTCSVTTEPPNPGGGGNPDVVPPSPGDNGGTDVVLPSTGGALVRPLAIAGGLVGLGGLLVVAARRRRRGTRAA